MTGGQLVLTTGHAVVAGGQLVLTTGQAVVCAGQVVVTGGHLVAFGGHAVVTRGQAVEDVGHCVVTGRDVNPCAVSGLAPKERNTARAAAIARLDGDATEIFSERDGQGG